jgi:uncharacterized integral membrane protein
VEKGEKFMLSIIFSAIFGLVIGYFALQNATPVSIQVGEFIFPDVPLYLVAVGSLILGIVIASIFYLARTVSANMTVHGRHHQPTTDNRRLSRPSNGESMTSKSKTPDLKPPTIVM